MDVDEQETGSGPVLRLRMSWPFRGVQVLTVVALAALWRSLQLPGVASAMFGLFLAYWTVVAVTVSITVNLTLTGTHLEFPVRRGRSRVRWDEVTAVGAQDRWFAPKLMLTTTSGAELLVLPLCMTRIGVRPRRATIETWWQANRAPHGDPADPRT